jgi:hypothetical protein
VLADTPIARATSIPISDFDEAVDDIVQIMALIYQTLWYMSSLLARRPHLQ